MTQTLPSDAILERLLALHPKLIDLSLDRVMRLMARLDHPEERLPPVIHIAGTNGKGSTLAYLEAMGRAAGHRVHTYTSPHLVRFHERIRLDGAPIAEPALAALLEECEEANGGAPITFFEITTAAAFLAFSRTPADLLLLETGLGGRLDATNLVARPALCAITPIGMDHIQYLGETLAAIAGEKAGILKPGVRGVIAAQKPEAAAVIAARAEAIGAPLDREGEAWSWRDSADGFAYREAGREIALPQPSLAGRHQLGNAALAAACALRLPTGLTIPESAIRRGIAEARWPARLQRLESGPLVELLPVGWQLWLDGGHNADAGQALAEELRRRMDRPLHLIVGMLDTKDAGGFLHPFAGLARSCHCVTIPDTAAALSAESLAEAARLAGLEGVAAESVEAALADLARPGAAPGKVLICGSLYLAGHILAIQG